MYGPLVRGWTQQLLWSVDSGKNDSGPVLGIALNWLGLFHSLPFGTLTHDTFPLEIQAPCCEKPIHMKGPLDVIQVTAPIEHSVPSHGETVLDVLLSLQVSAAPPQSGCNHMYVCVCLSLSCVQLFVTPWTVACQVPMSMEFSRQDYWSGLPFPSPGNLPDLRTVPSSPVWQSDSLPSEKPGEPAVTWETATELLLVKLHKHKQ